MQIRPIPKRPLKEVFHVILHAVEIMETRFGAVLTHDSGRDRKNNKHSTSWIFTFPEYKNAQVLVPMNKGKIRFLMRSRTVDGKSLDLVMKSLAVVEKTYTDPKKGAPSSALGKHARFLNPSPTSPLLSIVPAQEGIEELLRLYLGVPSPTRDSVASISDNSGEEGATQRIRRQLTAEELQRQLDRNSKTGRAGELLVLQEEQQRLRELGCLNPEHYVKRVAETDVGRGYDVESTWPGHERCIEVKSTTFEGSDFFISENERHVLTQLGSAGWLYRVLVNADGAGRVVSRMQDPFGHISSQHMTPMVWRIAAEVLDSREEPVRV